MRRRPSSPGTRRAAVAILVGGPGGHAMCEARRVLVVEDHPLLRRLLDATLTAEGYAVTAAADGAEALDQLPRADPCLILLDLRMPVLDGHAFGRAYRALPAADAHIVVMTAEPVHTPLPDIRPAAVVAKPFDLDHVVDVVARWVRAHAPRGPSRPLTEGDAR